MSILTISDFRSEDIKHFVEENETYLDLANSKYNEWLMRFGILDCSELPLEADVSQIVKDVLVTYVSREVARDNAPATIVEINQGGGGSVDNRFNMYNKIWLGSEGERRINQRLLLNQSEISPRTSIRLRRG